MNYFAVILRIWQKTGEGLYYEIVHYQQFKHKCQFTTYILVVKFEFPLTFTWAQKAALGKGRETILEIRFQCQSHKGEENSML